MNGGRVWLWVTAPPYRGGVFSRPLILRAHTGASNFGRTRKRDGLPSEIRCREFPRLSAGVWLRQTTANRNAPAVPICRTPTRPWQLFLAPFPLSPLRGKFGQSREKLHLVSDDSRLSAAVGFAASRRPEGSALWTPAAFEKAGETFTAYGGVGYGCYATF